MATQPRVEDSSQATDSQQEANHTGDLSVRWGGKIEEQYRKIKENAETYVWGSYILVYGGFGLWLTYRWRKLCKVEDRVRVLHEKLRKLVEAEQSANSTSLMNKLPPSADKVK